MVSYEKLSGLVKNLELNQSIKFSYDVGVYRREVKEFELQKLPEIKGEEGKGFLVVKESDTLFSKGMNVKKITPTYIKCYTYNIFGKQEKFNLPLSEIEIKKNS